ncbi:hypothetical protein HAX54_009069, partial [Datura stramonium]|nr:hypothetical protein [Datura stramonium]
MASNANKGKEIVVADKGFKGIKKVQKGRVHRPREPLLGGHTDLSSPTIWDKVRELRLGYILPSRRSATFFD